MVVGGLVRRETLIRAGNLANVAAYGWKAIAAARVLALGAADGLPAAALALAAARRRHAAARQLGRRPGHLRHAVARPSRSRALVRMLADVVPAAALMLTLATVTSVLTVPLGLFALVVFALIAVLPQSALTYAARTRPVGRLDPLTRDAALRARARAAPRLCSAASAGTSRAWPSSRSPAAPRRAIRSPTPARTMRDPSRASWEAGHVCEWWNGAGGPAGLRGPVTPLTARIVAVADTWSALTARGGPQLSHADALEELDNASGARFDPRIVLAAHSVVAEERVSALEPAPEPRLHLLRLPAPLRRVLAAS